MHEGDIRDQVASLRTDHLVLAGKVEVLGQNLDSKHKENRASIHQLRNNDQSILDAIHRIDVKIARYVGMAIGAMFVFGAVYKLLDKVWK